MDTKKNKYDTNPLDPDVARKSEEEWGEGGGGTPTAQWVQEPTGKVGNSTEDNSRKNVYSEAPTRRYDNPPLEAPYPSVFVPPTYAPPQQQQQFRPNPKQNPNIYQPPVSRSGTVAGIGIPENLAVVLPYAPFFIGLVVSLLELFLVPRREAKVRYHASQAVALHIAILIIQTIFSAISAISGTSLGGTLFKVAAFAFLVVSMIRVGRGEPHRIAPLEEPAKWFNEHIEPRNQS
ncbi:MAG TPA: hypothetical protein VI306_10035 [Pyrinomonadaceae bacterium]